MPSCYIKHYWFQAYKSSTASIGRCVTMNGYVLVFKRRYLDKYQCWCFSFWIRHVLLTISNCIYTFHKKKKWLIFHQKSSIYFLPLVEEKLKITKKLNFSMENQAILEFEDLVDRCDKILPISNLIIEFPYWW